MSEALLDTEYVTIYALFSRPLSFTLLEAVVVTCGVLTFVDARRRARAGDTESLLAWTSIFTYGLFIELLSYNFIKSFAHGQFPVMFYRRQLPLYISTIYPVFIYTAFRSVRRYGLGRWAEPFAVGLTIVALDMPFDILGPGAGWWSWSTTDANTAYRWLNVPVTSYYWHLAFGGVLVLQTRLLSQWLKDVGGWKLLLAIPVGVMTIVFGVLLFIPFHVLKAQGVADGTVVLGLFAVSLLIFLRAKKTLTPASDPLPLMVATLFIGFHVVTAVAFLAAGRLERAPEKLACIAIAVFFGAAVQFLSRRPTPATVLPSGASTT